MRRTLALGLILIVLSANIGNSATDGDVETCAYWGTLDEQSKAMLVHGWLMAVNAISSIAKIDETADKLLWPEGHRVGGVVLEMNVACRKPENRNQKIMHMMMIISGTLNGLGK